METGRTIVGFEKMMAVVDVRPGCSRVITEGGPAQKRTGRKADVPEFGPRSAASHYDAQRPRAHRRL